MRIATFGAAAAVVTSVLSAASPSRAQNGATLVAIVTAEPASPLTRRVREELQGLGVDVIVLKPPVERELANDGKRELANDGGRELANDGGRELANDDESGSISRAPLERAARSVGAIAAIRLVASSEGKVEVWVADRVTGKAVVRELDAAESGASDAAVAVGTVELLRASLMELHSGEPPRGDAPATEVVKNLALPAATPTAPPRLGLSMGAGAELGVRGLGPSLDADLAIWVRVTSRIGARFVGQTPIAQAHVTTSTGSIDVGALLLGAMISCALADPSATWVPSLSLGVAAARVSATGNATFPFRSSSDLTWSVAPLAGVDLAWAFMRGLRLRADALAAWAAPAVDVSTPATHVGSWGAPALAVSLGIEVLWGP